MGGSSTDTSSKTNQVSEPWGPAQQPLKDILNQSKQMYDFGVGPQVYGGSTVTPFSAPTQAGLTQGFTQAQAGNPLSTAATNYATSALQSGGANPFQIEAKANLDPTAKGDMLNGNPFFQQALDFQSNKAADKVNSIFSGAGRGLSGSHARTLADELAGLRFGALSDNYNMERGLQMGANQTIAGMGADANANSNAVLSNANNIDALRYNDIDRMLKIGTTVEGKQQQVLDENKAKFDQQNMLPWQHLELYKNMINPNVGGTTTGSTSGSTSTPFNPMSLLGIPLMAGGK